MTFNNNGEVIGNSSKHSVRSKSQVNVTINNKGSIKAVEGQYALLFYGNSTVVFNAYAGSTLTKAANKDIMTNNSSNHAKLVTFNVQTGADGVENDAYYGMKPFTTTYDCKLVINFDANLQ